MGGVPGVPNSSTRTGELGGPDGPSGVRELNIPFDAQTKLAGHVRMVGSRRERGSGALRRWIYCCLTAAVGVLLLACPARAQTPPVSDTPPAPPDTISFIGGPGAAIPAGVILPAGKAVVWLGATSPPVFNERAEPGTRERYGDTKIQAGGVLRRIDEQLRPLGLSLADVVYLRVYLAPDPALGGIDRTGWQQAYLEQFGTLANPNRPAMAVLGVAALGDPDWLIEVEAFAVFPD